jgi:hypothetical protein
VHRIDQRNDVIDRGRGQNPMPQIKNMSGPFSRLGQDMLRPLPDRGAIGIEHDRIQISLNRHIAETLPSLTEFNAPIHADHIATGLAPEL